MTVLKDSSDFLSFSSLTLLRAEAEGEEMAKCVLCGILGESTIHLIRDCAFAKRVWLATPIGIPPSPPYVLSMLDWILNWTSYLNLWNFALGLMVLWEIWGARNNGLWNDRMDSPDIIAARGGFHNVILESDSLQIVTLLHNSLNYLSDIGLLIEDSRVILSSTTGAYATMFVAKSIVLLIALHGLPLLQVGHVTGFINLRTSSQIYCLTKLFCN
ncbi:hypothetical protein ACFX15_023361 [Malus domestica]